MLSATRQTGEAEAIRADRIWTFSRTEAKGNRRRCWPGSLSGELRIAKWMDGLRRSRSRGAENSVWGNGISSGEARGLETLNGRLSTAKPPSRAVV